MEIVILAAGQGKRLGLDRPKCLAEVIGGQCIINYQIEHLSIAFPGATMRIVVGHQHEMVHRAVTVSAEWIYSPLYASQNTARSLELGIADSEQDVLWINGDVLFHPKVLKVFKGCNRPSLLVNEGRVGAEEVKYRLGDEGCIVELSKEVVGGVGESLGINFFPRSALPLLRDKLDLCAEQDYFERAVQGCIDDGMAVYPLVVPINECIEVDFPDDLERARVLVREWRTKTKG